MSAKKTTTPALAGTVVTLYLLGNTADSNAAARFGENLNLFRYREAPSAYYAAYRKALTEALAAAPEGATRLRITYPDPIVEVLP